MHDPAPKQFPLATLDSRGLMLSASLLIVIPWLILAGSFVAVARNTHAHGDALQGLWPVLFCTLVWVAIVIASRRSRVTVDGPSLTVRSTFFRSQVPLAALDLGKARLFDREEHTELRPGRKRIGVGMPGFHSGNFKLRNGQRAFVAVASGRWRLWLPRHDGTGLLLEPQDPRALLETLRGATTAAPVRLAATRSRR